MRKGRGPEGPRRGLASGSVEGRVGFRDRTPAGPWVKERAGTNRGRRRTVGRPALPGMTRERRGGPFGARPASVSPDQEHNRRGDALGGSELQAFETAHEKGP